MENKKMFIVIIAIIMLFSYKQDSNVESKANDYMEYLNSHRIKGGCYYIKNDTIITKRNHEQASKIR